MLFCALLRYLMLYSDGILQVHLANVGSAFLPIRVYDPILVHGSIRMWSAPTCIQHFPICFVNLLNLFEI